MANVRYHNLQKNVKLSSMSINKKKETSAASTSAMSANKSGIDVEDIELGIINNGIAKPNEEVENSATQFSWLKYLIFFTISHQSYFVKALSGVSILFNIVLSIIIPYEVQTHFSLCVYYRLNLLQTFYNERHVSFRVIILISEVFYLIEVRM